MVFLIAFTVIKELICAALLFTLFVRCWELQILEHPHTIPKGNGQVERFNRTVEAMLSKMVQLPKALFAYRTAVHKATKFSLFISHLLVHPNFLLMSCLDSYSVIQFLLILKVAVKRLPGAQLLETLEL